MLEFKPAGSINYTIYYGDQYIGLIYKYEGDWILDTEPEGWDYLRYTKLALTKILAKMEELSASPS